MVKQKVSRLLKNDKFILIVYALIAVIISIITVIKGNTQNFQGGNGDFNYTWYNNYIIFKQSYFHLIDQLDLYVLYLDEQWDLYKYSPTFSLFMGTMAYLPDVLGLSIWNLINVYILYWGLKSLSIKPEDRTFILLFILLELITSIQNSQSNALMAGLMIASMGLLEKNKTLWATLLIVLATYVKIYGAVAFAFFLFYPNKPKFILYSAMWMVIFFALPLLVTPFDTLIDQYISWGRMMSEDQAASDGLSVVGWLHSWFGLDNIKTQVSVAGILLFFVPLLRYKQYPSLAFRQLFLAFTLLWVIIFNHKAESSTYIIAMAGVALWYVNSSKGKWQKFAVFLAFFLISLTPTDLFTPIRISIMQHYAVKAVGGIFLWCIIFYDLLFEKKSSPDTISTN